MAKAVRVYDFRPWSNGSGQKMRVDVAMPMYKLFELADERLNLGHYRGAHNTLPRMTRWFVSPILN